MCAITGIALVSCMVRQPNIYENIAGERWCFVAFSQLPLCGDEILSISLVLFAFATIVGWNYYGTCARRCRRILCGGCRTFLISRWRCRTCAVCGCCGGKSGEKYTEEQKHLLLSIRECAQPQSGIHLPHHCRHGAVCLVIWNTMGTPPFSCWSAATFFSHRVKKAVTSSLSSAVSI